MTEILEEDHTNLDGQSRMMQPIAPLASTSDLQQVIEATPLLMSVNARFVVYCRQLEPHSILLQSIGSLRESNFRQIGQGTGLARDLSDYDCYYDHLILWDNNVIKSMKLVESLHHY